MLEFVGAKATNRTTFGGTGATAPARSAATHAMAIPGPQLRHGRPTRRQPTACSAAAMDWRCVGRNDAAQVGADATTRVRTRGAAAHHLTKPLGALVFLAFLWLIPAANSQTCPPSPLYDCNNLITVYGAGDTITTVHSGAGLTSACSGNLTGPPVMTTCSKGPPKSPFDQSVWCTSKAKSNLTVTMFFERPLW